MHERDHRGEREGKLEAKRDEDDDYKERRRHGLHGLPPDLTAERRADAFDADLRPELILQGLPNLRVFFLAQDRCPHLVTVLTEALHERPLAEIPRQSVPHFLRTRRLLHPA